MVNNAATQYSGLHFTDLAVINGEIIGSSTSGMFKLSGDTDAGKDISADFKLFSTNLGIPNEKRIRNFTIYGQTAGNLIIYPVADDDEGEVHEIEALPSNFSRKHVVFVNRDNQGAALSIRICNKNSAYFLIDSIDILPVILGTRI